MAAALSVFFSGVGAPFPMTLGSPAPFSSSPVSGPKAWFEMEQDVNLLAMYVLVLSLILYFSDSLSDRFHLVS